MRNRNKWVNILLWGQILDMVIAAIGISLDIIGIIKVSNPLLFYVVIFVVFAVITFFRQGLLTHTLNEIMPVVSINYWVEKKSLSFVAGMIQHKESYAVVEFSNNPKTRSESASAKNVYAKISYFLSDLTPLYQNLEGLWFPYKFEKPSDLQVRINGETELLPTGRKERLMVAQKHNRQGPIVVIENDKTFFSGFPFGSDANYSESHFLLHDKKYYVLIELFGTRLAENYMFELWEEGNKLFFTQVKDKKICEKIISAKK